MTPKRDPDTGLFVADDDPRVMPDGGLPGGFIDEAYHGSGGYVDVEQVCWNYNRLVDTDGVSGQSEDSDTETIISMDNVLDRREEMADLIYMDVGLHLAAVNEDDNVTPSPRHAVADAAISTGEVGLQLLSISPFQTGDTDDEEANTSRDVDCIGRRLHTAADLVYEDGSNSAGGGGNTSDHDGWTGHGHEITADPTFEERDDIEFNYQLRQHQEVQAYLQASVVMVFGLYELQEQAVKR